MRFSQLEGARVGVWGAGREIASFARMLERRLRAARIVVAAFDGPPPADARGLLRAPGARLVDASEAVAALSRCDAVVRSPGVSVHREGLRALRSRGVPVTTATGLWLAERGPGSVLGVTGTKGKSTTAALAAHLARAAGATVHLAGNIGVPALDLLDAAPGDLDVVELSSYQTADLEYGPEVAVLTALFPEHADWHGSHAAYRADKLRLFGLPGVRAWVLSGREPLPLEPPPEIELRLFGVAGGWDASREGVSHDGELAIPAGELPLPGPHNALNLCAALTALEAAGAAAGPLPASLRGFQALPHRLQEVAVVAGVSWIDDSISTTPESALAALESFPDRPVVLIAGGQDRGQDHAALAAALAARDASLVAVPSTGPRLLAAARAGGVPAERALAAADLCEAVTLARRLAPPGAVVLLSPAAPSYDSFESFEQRGELFTALARGGGAA